MKYILVICILLSSFFGVSAQDENWMVPPIKHGVGLAGTFGELRKNHFHTGVDIKSSNGRTGDPILAVADGVVSRIKVSFAGYGNTLYIDHPNGHTTVYAHLQKFRPDLEDFIDSLQYAKQVFEIDTLLASSEFLVTQGEQIGVMGTSGRSYGPHLHFEVRNTKSEQALNPLEHGIEVRDDIAPRVNYMILQYLNDELKLQSSKKIALTKESNIYKPKEKMLSIPAWRIGVVAFVRDLMTGVSNRNGIYEGELEVDGKVEFMFRMDTISFDDFRKLNGHIDYDYYQKKNVRAHQLYKKPGMNMGIYKQSQSGVIPLYASKPRDVKVSLRDYEGNTSEIVFSVLRDTSMLGYPGINYNYFLPFGEPHIISRGDVKIRFSESCFYENTYLSVERSDEKEYNYASPVFHIGDPNQATFGYFDLYIQHEISDSTLLNKAIVAACDKNEYTSFGGTLVNDMIGTKVRDFGSYVVMLDTVPPTISVVSAPYELKKGSSIILKIDDNMEVRGYAKDLRYEAYLDGDWILFQYDLKTKRIKHTVDERWKPGKHKISVKVYDDRNNETIWTKDVLYSN